MRDTFTKLHVHIVWATWDRQPLIRPDREADIYRCIKDACWDLKARVAAIGGIEDHVHLLVDIPPAVSVSYLVQIAKGTSSNMVNSTFGPRGCFKWQGAYAAFAVSESHVRAVEDYIQRQKQHHDTGSTIPELEWEMDSPHRSI
jgi:REP element-mobilizing transposase RayT